MTPRIKHRQPIDVYPVDASKLEVGDIVIAKVHGRIFCHLVSAIRQDQIQISNNHGHANGWTSRKNVFGIVTAVDGVELKEALGKIASQ